MNKFIIEHEFTKDLKLIKLTPFKDERGEYIKSYSDREFLSIGIHSNFLEDNYLISKKGSVRGLHYQKENPEAKLIRCMKGKIIDIAVDLRENSNTYKKVFKIELNGGDNRILFVPEGFAHGFLSLSDSVILYKSSNYYFPEDQYGISVFSEEIQLNEILKKIEIKNTIITDKDRGLPKLSEL